MATLTMNKRSQLLEAAAESLDIPPRLYEEAVLKYEDIGGWLAAEDSALREYTPEIYPQGSFRLGTMVRPIFRSDEYDIDLVCRLVIDKDAISKTELKKMIGDRLKKRDDIKRILSESRRAWMLDYPPQFHMDVLSSIPNQERRPSGILLPDKELHIWQKSNPIVYAEWFYDRMKVIFQEKRAALAEELQASIEEVPYWNVKTPLQRVVQILKRHRDIYFQNDPDNRPVSIIITTLAARAYRNQAEIFDALIDGVKAMPNYIEKRGDTWWVQNPVEPDENFAERWNEYPNRRQAFFDWMARAHSDFVSAGQQADLRKVAEDLAPALGRTTMTKAAASLGLGSQVLIESTATKSDEVPVLSDSRHCQSPPWPLAVGYRASISGTVHRDLYQTKKLWDLTTRSVPKGVGLRFKVTTNVPEPYEVRWQVVNTGREAAVVGQLRGGFEEGNSQIPGVRWESTAYAGTHWVEGFVLKNGVCVARTGQKRVRVRG
jgi:hypothetical protein